MNNGFYYYGFASNLLPGPAIQPFLDCTHSASVVESMPDSPPTMPARAQSSLPLQRHSRRHAMTSLGPRTKKIAVVAVVMARRQAQDLSPTSSF